MSSLCVHSVRCEASILLGPCAGRQKAKVKSRARAKPAETTPKPVVQPEPHKPVDYSKFENIQTSDDEDEQPHPGHHCEECAGAARVQL